MFLCDRLTLFVSTLKDSFVLDAEDDYWILHGNVVLYHKNIMKIITIWDTVAVIYGLWVWFCGGDGGGVGGGKHLIGKR